MTPETRQRPARSHAAQRRAAPRPAGRQRGVATLVVVMALFFVISLVAAYASRNLIFEQRTSANQYRSTQAFEAAEAGIEWALAMLNAGRVDATCQPTADDTFDSFRARFLRLDAASGQFTPATWLNGATNEPLRAICVRTAAGWNCSCPRDSAPAIAAADGIGSFPAFSVRFQGVGRDGLVRAISVGCTSGNAACLAQEFGSAGDAAAVVSSVIGLARALPTIPAAPLTTRSDIAVAQADWWIVNTTAGSSGLAIQAGGTVDAPGARHEIVAGSMASRAAATMVVAEDEALAATPADKWFLSLFGVDRDTFKRQPATVRVVCEGDCGGRLQDAVANNPGRPLWVSGDLVIGGDITLGSETEPVLIVAEGNITLGSPGIRIHGLVHTQAAVWTTDGSGRVIGAVTAEGRAVGATAPDLYYDIGALATLRNGMGSFIRVPGGWKDF